MKALYNEEDYCQARGKDLLPFECYGCGQKFLDIICTIISDHLK